MQPKTEGMKAWEGTCGSVGRPRFVYMLMELRFEVALVRGHPADEGLRLGVNLSSNVLE